MCKRTHCVWNNCQESFSRWLWKKFPSVNLFTLAPLLMLVTNIRYVHQCLRLPAGLKMAITLTSFNRWHHQCHLHHPHPHLCHPLHPHHQQKQVCYLASKNNQMTQVTEACMYSPKRMNFRIISEQLLTPAPFLEKYIAIFSRNLWPNLGWISKKFAIKFFRSKMTPPHLFGVLRKFIHFGGQRPP